MEWTFEQVERIARGWGDELTTDGATFHIKGEKLQDLRFTKLVDVLVYYQRKARAYLNREQSKGCEAQNGEGRVKDNLAK